VEWGKVMYEFRYAMSDQRVCLILNRTNSTSQKSSPYPQRQQRMTRSKKHFIAQKQVKLGGDIFIAQSDFRKV
jgi:hypothetical protein